MPVQNMIEEYKDSDGDGRCQEVSEKHPCLATQGNKVRQHPRHTTEHQERMTQIDKHGCLRKTGGEKACKRASMQGDKITNRHNAE